MTTYTVQSGDTLSRIASRYGTTAGAIARANGISDPNKIKVGQRLTIGGNGAGQSTATATPTVSSSGSGSGGPTQDAADAIRASIAKLDGAMQSLAKVDRSKLTPGLTTTYNSLVATGTSLRSTCSKLLGVAEAADRWVDRAATAVVDFVMRSKAALGLGAIPVAIPASLFPLVAIGTFCAAVGLFLSIYNTASNSTATVDLQKQVYESSIKAGSTPEQAAQNAKDATGQKPGFFANLSTTAKYGAMGLGALVLLAVIPRSAPTTPKNT